ncbi:hypothetical protein ZWY2020_049191 [Hordeum vulgare]|nr:hypothetical protein ZWY2020_049191 [Hordeum vulgare]
MAQGGPGDLGLGAELPRGGEIQTGLGHARCPPSTPGNPSAPSPLRCPSFSAPLVCRIPSSPQALLGGSLVQLSNLVLGVLGAGAQGGPGEQRRTWTGFSMEAFAFKELRQFAELTVPSAMMVCLEWWSFVLLVLLSGLLPNPKLETSVLSICLNTGALMFTVTSGLCAAISVGRLCKHAASPVLAVCCHGSTAQSCACAGRVRAVLPGCLAASRSMAARAYSNLIACRLPCAGLAPPPPAPPVAAPPTALVHHSSLLRRLVAADPPRSRSADEPARLTSASRVRTSSAPRQRARCATGRRTPSALHACRLHRARPLRRIHTPAPPSPTTALLPGPPRARPDALLRRPRLWLRAALLSRWPAAASAPSAPSCHATRSRLRLLQPTPSASTPPPNDVLPLIPWPQPLPATATCRHSLACARAPYGLRLGPTLLRLASARAPATCPRA